MIFNQAKEESLLCIGCSREFHYMVYGNEVPQTEDMVVREHECQYCGTTNMVSLYGNGDIEVNDVVAGVPVLYELEDGEFKVCLVESVYTDDYVIYLDIRSRTGVLYRGIQLDSKIKLNIEEK